MKNLLSYKILIPLVLLLGLAPFYPQPHIVEKVSMLMAGTLKRPIDIFDLVWHALCVAGLPDIPGHPTSGSSHVIMVC